MSVPLRWAIALALTSLAPAADAVAAPTRLTFIAVETSDGTTRVMSRLYRREDAGVGIPVTTPNGPAALQFEHNETECSVEVQYRVVPVNAPLYTFPPDDWRSCIVDATYRYEFTPNLDSADAAIIYRIFTGGVGDAGLGLNPEQTAILEEAIARGDLGTITFYSTELGSAFDAAGDTELARQWRNAAIASGWAAVAGAEYARAPEVATPYTFEGDRLVYSDEALSVIQGYQAEVGAPDDGRLNWPTMRSLSDLASEDILALGQQKLDLIEPIKGFER